MSILGWFKFYFRKQCGFTDGFLLWWDPWGATPKIKILQKGVTKARQADVCKRKQMLFCLRMRKRHPDASKLSAKSNGKRNQRSSSEPHAKRVIHHTYDYG